MRRLSIQSENGGKDRLTEDIQVDEEKFPRFFNLNEDIFQAHNTIEQVIHSIRRPGGRSINQLSAKSHVFLEKLDEEFFQDIHNNGFTNFSAPPKITTEELATKSEFEYFLRTTPNELVGFKMFRRNVKDPNETNKAEVEGNTKPIDKRMIRVKNASKLPLDVWASFVHSHSIFSSLILFLIVINALILGIQTRTSRESDPVWDDTFDMIDVISLLVFSLEILLKWIDDFKGFWNDGWNVFDFVVTLLSAVPNMLPLFTGEPNTEGGIENQFRVFRTLRLLKMIAKVRNLRVIIKTIFDAFKSMAWILMLLCMFAYIFAIFAVNLFAAYTDSTDPTLKYQEKFANLQEAFISLFQLLTLDQWYFIEKDVHRVVPAWTSILFFLIWVWLGAFIFRNVFVGVMVKEFQEITKDFKRAAEEKKRAKMAKKRLHQLEKMLKKKEQQDTKATTKLMSSFIQENHEVFGVGGVEQQGGVWSESIKEAVEALKSDYRRYKWPQDLLFLYLRTLYEMEENLQEYEELQHMASCSIMSLVE